MDKQISLKLFYVGTDEVRRLKILSSTKFDDFLQQVQKYYPSENSPKLKLLYLDEDGDWITMDSQIEWEHMISNFHGDLLRIRAKPSEKKSNNDCKDSKQYTGFEEMFGNILHKALSNPEKVKQHFANMFAPVFQQYSCGQTQTPQNSYDSEIKTLVSMGFYDKQKNLELLKRYHGNINRVVQHYVEQQ